MLNVIMAVYFHINPVNEKWWIQILPTPWSDCRTWCERRALRGYTIQFYSTSYQLNLIFRFTRKMYPKGFGWANVLLLFNIPPVLISDLSSCFTSSMHFHFVPVVPVCDTKKLLTGEIFFKTNSCFSCYLHMCLPGIIYKCKWMILQ